MNAIAPIIFDTEATVQGQQVLVLGVRPVSMKVRLEVLAAHPLGSNRLQKPCDIGLFDDVARNQMELFSAAKLNPTSE